jgi:hypothetical protein
MAEDDFEEFKRLTIKQLILTAGETRVLMSCLSSMGMTPKDRARVVPITMKAGSRFGRLSTLMTSPIN